MPEWRSVELDFVARIDPGEQVEEGTTPMIR